MQRGFSLIELIFVLAIISILACLTYPGYKHHIVRMHRVDGQTALFNLANQMEQYYTSHNTYKHAAQDLLKNPNSPEGWYTLSIIEATEAAFRIQATANVQQAMNDPLCQSLSLNHIGVKGGFSDVCW